MKLRNLFMGSVAAAGLSTGAAYAADLGVLTSLDVCDNLGLSGLTISSDSNCLVITGGVEYKFKWGDFANSPSSSAWPSGIPPYDVRNGPYDADAGYGDGYTEWESRLDAWITFAASQESDFGTAKAVIKLEEVDKDRGYGAGSGWESSWDTTGTSSDTDGIVLDEAYVSIGDSTVITAGLHGSVFNDGDDEPLDYLTPFWSEDTDAGVDAAYGPDDGGGVIQVTTDLGNGVSVSAGLENLGGPGVDQLSGGTGTAVGTIAYATDGISAHISGKVGGILNGYDDEYDSWALHAGFVGTFDNFKVVLAGAFSGYDDDDHYDVLASASATFDMFTLAGSIQATGDDYDGSPETDYSSLGVSGSVAAAVTDTVKISIGGRWLHEEIDEVDEYDSYEVAAQVVAAVTESLTLTGEVGYVNSEYSDYLYDNDDVIFGSAKLEWAPGGGYTSSIKATVNTDDAYKIETAFKKEFE